MFKYILIAILVLKGFSSLAQHRILFSDNSQVQSYHNPALSGFQSSVVRSIYRSQWTGFEDAPKTMFALAELDLKLMQRQSQAARDRVSKDNLLGELNGVKHAAGLSVLHDKFGPYRFTQFSLSYGSGIRLSQSVALRWGSALTFQSNSFDANSLNVDQENDPKYRDVVGADNKINKADLNIGLALTTSKFLLGYAIQNVTKGSVLTSGDAHMEDMFTRGHVMQLGYRTNVTEKFGLVANTLYQYDQQNEGLFEGQVKATYSNMFWIGAGYRQQLAYSAIAGVQLQRFILGYAYEAPVKSDVVLQQPSNQITLSFNLLSSGNRNPSNKVAIW